jgi:hypothetical protein
MVLGKLDICTRMKLDILTLHHIQKLAQRVRPECVDLLEENIGKTFLDTGLGNKFLDMASEAHKQQKQTEQLSTAKEMINRV